MADHHDDSKKQGSQGKDHHDDSKTPGQQQKGGEQNKERDANGRKPEGGSR